MLSVENISLAFGGVQGPDRHQLRCPRTRDPRHHRPERRGQELDAQRASTASIARSRAAIRFRRRDVRGAWIRTRPPTMGIARTFQNIALFKGMSVLDNLMTGRNLRCSSNLLAAGAVRRRRTAARSSRTAQGRGDHRLPADRAHPQDAGRAPALRPAEARGTGARARRRTAAAAAGRAHGRHERRGETGHVPLHPRRERRVRHHHRADRARHGRGHGHLATASWCWTTARKIGDGAPEEIRANQAVIDAYLGVAH